MTVTNSFSQAIGGLRDRPLAGPLLLLVAVPLTMLNSPDLWAGESGLAFQVVGLLITPFLLGGGYGLARETLDGGDVSPLTVLAYGADNYLSLLGVSLLFVLGALATFFVLLLVLVIPVVNLFAMLVAIPLLLFAVLVLQFVDVAVVVDDRSAVSAFVRSYGLATNHLGTVIGYTIARFGVSVVAFIPLVAANGWDLSVVTSPGPVAGPGGVLALVVFAGASVVLMPYHVAFYQYIGGGSRSTGGAWDDDEVQTAMEG